MDFSFALPLIRFLIVFPFLHSGVFCILNFKNSTKMIESRNLPLAPVGLACAIFTKLTFGLAVVFGIYTGFAALMLALYTIFATVLFHDFWKRQGMERNIEIFWVTTNTGLVGGLLLLATL